MSSRIGKPMSLPIFWGAVYIYNKPGGRTRRDPAPPLTRIAIFRLGWQFWGTLFLVCMAVLGYPLFEIWGTLFLVMGYPLFGVSAWGENCFHLVGRIHSINRLLMGGFWGTLKLICTAGAVWIWGTLFFA